MSTATQYERVCPYLLVRAGGQAYALGVAGVVEVLRPANLVREADAASALLGFILLHGNTVAVFDLAALLGRGQSSLSETSRLVHVRLETQTAGLLVDDVIGVRQLLPTQFAAIDLPGGERRAVGRFEAGFASLLNVSGLVPPELLETLSGAAAGLEQPC